jgi:hypothetical protein
MIEQQTDGQTTWTCWLAVDEVAVPMALHADQTLDELGDTLLHLRDLGLLRFGHDEAGALYFQTRTDDAGRALALLDDHGSERCN